MKRRLGEALVAVLLWVIFGVGGLVVLVLFPLMVGRYVLTGNAAHREAVKNRGKALDQLFNVTFFGGNPKETLSSHAGRWLTEAPERAPWWVKVVATITGWVEKDHVHKAIERPFVGMPLE